MGRDVESQGRWRQVGEVEVERTTATAAGGQQRVHDAANWIHELTGHEHQYDDH